MLTLAVIGGLVLLWLGLELWRLDERAGLLALESELPFEAAMVSLRLARGYKLVWSDEARGFFVWERNRRFHDGGVFYYAQIWADVRTGRGRFVVGVIGHKFHRSDELASARSQFVETQLLHLTEESAEDARVRAADPRTARAVHRALRRLIGQQTERPPVTDAPMSSSALEFTVNAPHAEVADAIGRLSQSGWRLVETASFNRGLVPQRRFCFEDGATRETARAEYLLEVRAYADGYTLLAIDWFPRAEPGRPPRRPSELAADVSRTVAHVHAVREAAE
jgi:hypothetical protein